MTLETASELRKRGHDVAILTTEPILPGDIIPEKLEVKTEIFEGFHIWKLIIPHPIDVIERLDRESYEITAIDFFRNVLDEWNPDVVYVFHMMRLTAAFIEQVHNRKIHVYFISTDFWLVCLTYQLIRHDMALCSVCEPDKCYSCLVDLHINKNNGFQLKHIFARKYPRVAALFHKKSKEVQRIISHRHARHLDVMSKLNGIFFANTFMQKIFHMNNFKSAHEYIIPFPIPERSKKVFDLEMPSLNGTLKVVFVGTLRPTKGPQVLIAACSKIANRNDIEVQIWGAASDKAFEDDLKRRAGRIKWIHFRGTFPQEKLPDVLRENHVVVIPSLWHENTPLIALSSLAARRVLIVSDTGGLSSLVEHGVSGFVFPIGDSGVLASLMVKLSEDRELVRKVSGAVPKPYTVNEYVSKMLEVYEKDFNNNHAPKNRMKSERL